MHLQQLQSCPAWVPIGFCIPLTSVGEMSTSLTPWLLPSPPGCHKGTGQPWSHPGRESACCEDRTCWHGASGLQVHSSCSAFLCTAFLLHSFPLALLSSCTAFLPQVPSFPRFLPAWPHLLTPYR